LRKLTLSPLPGPSTILPPARCVPVHCFLAPAGLLCLIGWQ